MPDQSDRAADILRTAQASDRVRAAAWDAYYQAKDQADLETRLRDLPLPQEAKAQLWDAKGGLVSPAPATPESPARTWGDTAKDIGVGFVKGAARTALDAGQAIGSLPIIGDLTNAIGNAAGGLVGQIHSGTMSEPVTNAQAFSEARKPTQYANGPQMLGGALETGAELIAPGMLAADAVPTTTKAAAKFQDVMGAAKNVPVDINAPGQVALRIQQLADRGGSMPMAVRKFLARVTDPTKAPMVYEESRDFASNISRLSADEYNRLTPVMAREVANMRVALNEANAQAAKQAGKLSEYRAAMKEYAQAMRVRDVVNAAIEGAKQAIPIGGVSGAVYWMGSKMVKKLQEALQ